MIELAHTKVLCSVFGPHATDGRDFSEQGQLECSLRFASFARRGRERQNPAGSAEEKALSLALSAALAASVQLHLLPKSTIAVHALVLEDDGGALPAAVSCASLALADAAIELYDLVASCGCAMLPTAADAPADAAAHIALDATASELASATGTLSVAIMPSLDQVTLLRQEGRAPFERVGESLQLALSGCRLLHQKMTDALAAGAPGAATVQPAAELKVVETVTEESQQHEKAEAPPSKRQRQRVGKQ